MKKSTVTSSKDDKIDSNGKTDDIINGHSDNPEALNKELNQTGDNNETTDTSNTTNEEMTKSNGDIQQINGLAEVSQSEC